MTIGSSPTNSAPLIQIGGIKLGGLDPATGYASMSIDSPTIHPLKQAIIYLAGPATGTVASLTSFVLLRKHSSTMYLSKLVALYGLFNQTIGVAGAGGSLMGLPNHDITLAIKNLKAYLNN